LLSNINNVKGQVSVDTEIDKLKIRNSIVDSLQNQILFLETIEIRGNKKTKKRKNPQNTVLFDDRVSNLDVNSQVLDNYSQRYSYIVSDDENEILYNNYNVNRVSTTSGLTKRRKFNIQILRIHTMRVKITPVQLIINLLLPNNHL
jgi:archaellin